MKSKNKNSLFNYAQDKNRELAKEQGFYDGRFKQRVIKNKKKELIKKQSRSKIIVRRNAPSDRAKFNILTKTDREHNKICKFAEWKTLYQNQ